jgi:hypothetical protein
MVKCGFKDCTVKKACFGFKNESPKFCSKHKENGMIDLVNSKCVKCGLIQPTFGIEAKKPTHCGQCKTEEMYNVKDEMCIKCKNVRPIFAFKGEKATHCVSCKEIGMIDVIHSKCFCGKKIPSFGLQGHKATHCEDCKEKFMIDVVNKRCKTEFCDTQVKNNYEGYCAYCYGNLFPDSPIVRNFKTKERLVVDYIKDQYKDYDWVFDKTISDGCSKKRPDIYLDLGYQIIIIEVDENQHRQYEDICENKRMMALSQDVNHRPIVFIRFNPDKYVNEEKKNVPSCFSITKATGALKVNVKKNWNNRLETLKENIDYWIEKTTNKTIELVQLYYDEEI